MRYFRASFTPHCLKRAALALIAAVLVGAFPVAATYAQGGLTLTKFTIKGGGGDSSGGQFSLWGTVGQPEGGNLSGGQFSVIGGYWSPVIQDSQRPTSVLFLPIVGTSDLTDGLSTPSHP